MTLSTPHRRRAALAGLVAAGALALSGCGGSSGDDGTSAKATGEATGKTTSAPASAQQIPITIKGDTITPTNKRIEVALGKPVTMVITSDRSGELHVHSSPEQHIEFDAGTTKKTLTFDTAGIIEVEEHKSDTLIAQLEVR